MNIREGTNSLDNQYLHLIFLLIVFYWTCIRGRPVVGQTAAGCWRGTAGLQRGGLASGEEGRLMRWTQTGLAHSNGLAQAWKRVCLARLLNVLLPRGTGALKEEPRTFLRLRFLLLIWLRPLYYYPKTAHQNVFCTALLQKVLFRAGAEAMPNRSKILPNILPKLCMPKFWMRFTI